jgi:hypothetical protein
LRYYIHCLFCNVGFHSEAVADVSDAMIIVFLFCKVAFIAEMKLLGFLARRVLNKNDSQASRVHQLLEERKKIGEKDRESPPHRDIWQTVR